MAAAFCALQLADLGADVVKVENPTAGQVRHHRAVLDGEISSLHPPHSHSGRWPGTQSRGGKDVVRG